MKAKRLLALILAVVIALFAFSSCSKTPGEEEQSTEEATLAEENTADSSKNTVKLSVLKGPTGMGAAYLWSQSDEGKTANDYDITLDTDATTVGPKLMTGEYDIACVPTNLAASLYNKSNGKIKVAAVNTLGVLYLVAKDGAVSALSDLRGKTILASGQGTIAEYALNYVLESYGYTIGEDVTIEFTTEHSETVTRAIAGGYDVVLLPEPFVTQLTTKDTTFAVAINLTEEWENYGNCTLTMGCVAVNADFYEKNPQAVAKFLEDFYASVSYVNSHVTEAAALIEAHDIMASAVAQKAIPNCNIVCYTGEQMKTALTSCYQVLFDQNAQIIGGSIPGDDFFINVQG